MAVHKGDQYLSKRRGTAVEVVSAGTRPKVKNLKTGRVREISRSTLSREYDPVLEQIPAAKKRIPVGPLDPERLVPIPDPPKPRRPPREREWAAGGRIPTAQPAKTAVGDGGPENVSIRGPGVVQGTTASGGSLNITERTPLDQTTAPIDYEGGDSSALIVYALTGITGLMIGVVLGVLLAHWVL